MEDRINAIKWFKELQLKQPEVAWSLFYSKNVPYIQKQQCDRIVMYRSHGNYHNFNISGIKVGLRCDMCIDECLQIEFDVSIFKFFMCPCCSLTFFAVGHTNKIRDELEELFGNLQNFDVKLIDHVIIPYLFDHSEYRID